MSRQSEPQHIPDEPGQPNGRSSKRQLEGKRSNNNGVHPVQPSPVVQAASVTGGPAHVIPVINWPAVDLGTLEDWRLHIRSWVLNLILLSAPYATLWGVLSSQGIFGQQSGTNALYTAIIIVIHGAIEIIILYVTNAVERLSPLTGGHRFARFIVFVAMYVSIMFSMVMGILSVHQITPGTIGPKSASASGMVLVGGGILILSIWLVGSIERYLPMVAGYRRIARSGMLNLILIGFIFATAMAASSAQGLTSDQAYTDAENTAKVILAHAIVFVSLLYVTYFMDYSSPLRGWYRSVRSIVFFMILLSVIMSMVVIILNIYHWLPNQSKNTAQSTIGIVVAGGVVSTFLLWAVNRVET